VIIVKLRGGLGNQLFQYSLGRMLSIKHSSDLKLDVSEYGDDCARSYELDKYNVKSSIATEREIRETVGIGRLRYRLARRFGYTGSYRQGSYVCENDLAFDPTILDLPETVYLDGYWQSEAYFRPIANILREDLTCRDEQAGQNRALAQTIVSCESVSIHVRRGDYVSDPATHSFHGTCGLDYYRACIEIVGSRVRDPRFFLFSDDLDWVRDNLDIPFDTLYVDHNDARTGHEDVRLMSQCRHHIIANSSFSWWAAWLGTNPNKIIVAPRRWFADKRKQAASAHLVPDTWLRA
jgi:hypothetical protein